MHDDTAETKHIAYLHTILSDDLDSQWELIAWLTRGCDVLPSRAKVAKAHRSSNQQGFLNVKELPISGTDCTKVGCVRPLARTVALLFMISSRFWYSSLSCTSPFSYFVA